MALAAGCIIEFSNKGSNVNIGAVLSLAGTSVRIMLINGKETNLQQKKIFHHTSNICISSSNKENCKETLRQIDAKRKVISESIELEEIYMLLADDTRAYPLQEIAEFLFEPNDEDSCAALLRKISSDKIYFKQNKTEFTPVSEEELKFAIDQKQKREKQETENENFINSLIIAEKTGELTPDIEDKLPEIIKFAVSDDGILDISKRLTSLLGKAGFSDKRKLCELLVKIKQFKPDENLMLLRHSIPVEFGDINLNEYIESIDSFNPNDRIDLTNLKTWAIDTPGSKDRDDAFSMTKNNNDEYELLIHIADPAEFIKIGSDLDVEASKRGCSLYMPDQRINMLPPEISEERLSLTENGNKPALTISMTFTNEGVLATSDIFHSIITLDMATSYDDADKMSENDSWLQNALKLSSLLQHQREEMGAVTLTRQPELSLKVIDGVITVNQRDRDDKTQGMIAEFMVWANHIGAKWCQDNQIPCVYRVQDAPDSDTVLDDEFDPVAFFEVLRTFRKTVISMKPGVHSSLGLNGYTQITSPLRRYSDLLIHRQIKASIRKQDLPYTKSLLANTLLISDDAVKRANEAMRAGDTYFLLKYLKNMQAKEETLLSGIVVDVGLNEVTFYVDLLCQFKRCKKPSFLLSKGQNVNVRINQIDLFERTIRFSLSEI